MQFAAPQQSLLEDQAFLLESRGVIRLHGELAAEALQPLVTIHFPGSSCKEACARSRAR
jgi:folate-binding Fe-S cluster repair protein YgfZ